MGPQGSHVKRLDNVIGQRFEVSAIVNGMVKSFRFGFRINSHRNFITVSSSLTYEELSAKLYSKLADIPVGYVAS